MCLINIFTKFFLLQCSRAELWTLTPYIETCTTSPCTGTAKTLVTIFILCLK